MHLDEIGRENDFAERRNKKRCLRIFLVIGAQGRGRTGTDV